MAADRLPKLLLIGLLAAVGLAFMVAAAGAIVIWLLLSQQSPQVLGFVASFHFIASPAAGWGVGGAEMMQRS
jgi:hypothetical protein